jgi:hypothetical protein
MGKGRRYAPPSPGDIRIVKRFVIYLDLPVEDGLDGERQARWLETAYIWQRYKRGNPEVPSHWGSTSWAQKEDYKEQQAHLPRKDW